MVIGREPGGEEARRGGGGFDRRVDDAGELREGGRQRERRGAWHCGRATRLECGMWVGGRHG